jgi:toxin ParE1/3/4
VTDYRVLLTTDAARDLEQIYDYIAEHDLPQKADHVLDRIESVIDGLRSSPNRGSIPKELRPIGLRDFRDVYFKPYRIIYRVMDRTVYVSVIADGRRDLQSLLSRRVLEG